MRSHHVAAAATLRTRLSSLRQGRFLHHTLSCKINSMINRRNSAHVLPAVILFWLFIWFSVPAQVVTPTPLPAVSPTPVSTKPSQTLATLQSFIANRLARPELQRG